MRSTGLSAPRRALLSIALRVAVIACSFAACKSSGAHPGSYFDQTYLRAAHNWAFRNAFPGVDALFNAFDYGHATLYETLWDDPRAPRERLDRKELGFITHGLLVHPPRVALDEDAIAPGWEKLAPEIAAMFDWAHMLHRQIYDVWADDRIPEPRKDSSVARVLRYYKSRPALAFSSSPKSMNLMEGQPYSLAFRKRFPAYNGLIWSYHWLQMTLYEALLASSDPSVRRDNVAAVVTRFWYLLDSAPNHLPSTMPLSAAVAPRFSARYPEAAIIFDNLHSLHDVVSDILADSAIPRAAKRARLLEAAARYRDRTSSIVTIDEWKSMADAMGVANMGGVAPILPP
jgi:hypothetical protein